jgi:predicted dehydrogenase
MTKSRVLVVGVGSIGERHVRCFQRTSRAEVSICEINESLREDVASRYQLDRTYAGWDEAVMSDYDAAVICTPAHLHVPMSIDAAKQCKHLLIEKPLSVDLARVEELHSVVEESKVASMVAYVLRVHPSLMAMKQEIAAGRFGEPVHVIGVSGQHFPTYRPSYREVYYADRATGGGTIQDGLTHVMNTAEWLVGPVDCVAADCAQQVLEGVNVEDTVNVIARHGDVLGSYSMNQHQAPNESTLTVACQRGTARFEGHRARWRWMTEPGGTWYDEPAGELERDDLFVKQASLFLDVLAGQATPSCSLAEGEQTLRTNLAILEAADTGRWVSL